jgi:hypothetical protein
LVLVERRLNEVSRRQRLEPSTPPGNGNFLEKLRDFGKWKLTPKNFPRTLRAMPSDATFESFEKELNRLVESFGKRLSP